MRKNKYTKLSEKQIEEIRNLHSGGYSIASIAKEYQVSTSTIWYWTISDERRQNEIRQSVEYKIRTGKNKTTYSPERGKLHYSRHREVLRARYKEYYKKNKEIVCQKRREKYYRLKSLTKSNEI